MTLLATLFFRPPLGWLVTVLVLALIVGVVLWQAVLQRRGRWALLMRLVAVVLLGWTLLGPSTFETAGLPDPALPKLVLLVDTSASMAQEDVALPGEAGAVSRLDALRATWLSQATLDRLRAEAEVELVAFDQQIWPTLTPSLEAVGKATHLHDAAARFREQTLVVLSDGHDTSNAAQVPPAARSDGVAFGVPVGATQGTPDVSLQAWARSDRLYDGQSTQIEAQVYQRGLAGQSASVELLHHGVVVATRPLVLDTPLQQVAFDVQPELSPRTPTQVHLYTCRVVTSAYDEAYTANNHEAVFIQVTREKTRVLLVEGEPSWDTRALGRLMGAHPGFDLTAVYALGDRRRVTVRGETVTDARLLEPGTLARFDVVVLGQGIDRLVDLAWAAALAGYVEAGGAVVFAKGRPIQPTDARRRAMLDTLESISPAQFGERTSADLRLAVSEAARGNPLTELGGDEVISRLPGMVAATRVAGRQAASVVLLEDAGGGPDSAAVSTLRVGQGVTMAVLSEGLWRWELLPTSLAQYDSVYAVFWTRAMQWLASGGAFLPGQDVGLSLDRLTVQPGGTVDAEVTMRYAALQDVRPTLRLIGPDGSAMELATSSDHAGGLGRVRLAPEQLGVYRVELTVPGRPDLVDPAHPITAHFSVVDRSPELRDTAARPEVLQALAESRGGRCLGLDEVEPLIEHLRELRATRSAEEVAVYRFAGWPIFVMVLGGLGIEWLVRRRGGLL